MPDIIDLSLTYDPEMPGVSWETAKTLQKDGWNARLLHLYSHAGTHMDAPIHFDAGDQTIDNIPLQDCICRAWMVDADADPKSRMSTDIVKQYENSIRPGDGLVFRTGWSRYFKTDKYRNELPGISQELARWIVARNIKLIGVEPPSVADVNDLQEVTLIHRILLTGGVIIVEGLTNLHLVKSNPFTFMAFPLKIKDGDGSPARAMAIEDVILNKIMKTNED
jgi:arylformamidase